MMVHFCSILFVRSAVCIFMGLGEFESTGARGLPFWDKSPILAMDANATHSLTLITEEATFLCIGSGMHLNRLSYNSCVAVGLGATRKDDVGQFPLAVKSKTYTTTRRSICRLDCTNTNVTLSKRFSSQF